MALLAESVTGVWVGNDNGAPMDKVTGGSLPVAIWHDFMTSALEGRTPRDVPRGGGALVANAGSPTQLAPEVAPTPTPPQEEESGIGSLLNTILGGDDSTPTKPKSTPTQPAQKQQGPKLNEDTRRD